VERERAREADGELENPAPTCWPRFSAPRRAARENMARKIRLRASQPDARLAIRSGVRQYEQVPLTVGKIAGAPLSI